MIASALGYATLPRPASRFVAVTGPTTGFARVTQTLTLTATGLVGEEDVVLTFDPDFVDGLVYPASVTLTAAQPAATVLFTPTAGGQLALTFACDAPDIAAPPPFVFEAVLTVTRLFLDGPPSGGINVDSDLFTVTFDGVVAAPFTITPTATGPGAFTPAQLVIQPGQTSAQFRWKPTQNGFWQVGLTNNAGYTNPATLTFGAGIPPVLAATTIARGALTRTGCGGVPLRFLMETPLSGGAKTWTITGGNGQGHWQIDATTGEITPTAAGQGNLAGPYNLTIRATNDSGNGVAVLTINTRPNTYTVSKPMEVDGTAANQLRNPANRNALSGRRVEIARGTPYFAQGYHDQTDGRGAVTPPGTAATRLAALRIQGFGTNPISQNTGLPAGTQDPANSYTDHVVFTNEDDAAPAEIRDCLINGSRMIRLYRLRFRWRNPTPGVPTNYLIKVQITGNFGLPGFIDVEECDLGNPLGRPNEAPSGINVNGGIVTAPSDPRREISVEPTSYRLAVTNVRLLRNRLSWVHNGIAGGNLTDVLVEGNTIENFCSNAIFFGLSFCSRVAVRGNIVRAPQIHPLRLDDHRDMCQFGSTMVDRWWEDITIENNLFDQATGGGDAQGPFFNDSGVSSFGDRHAAARGESGPGVKPLTDPLGLLAGRAPRFGAGGTGPWGSYQWPTALGFRRVRITGNLISTVMANGITLDIGDDNLVENNTLVLPARFTLDPLLIDYATSKNSGVGRAAAPTIRLFGAKDLPRGINAWPSNVRVRRNITRAVLGETVGAPPALVDNVIMPNPVGLPVRNPGEPMGAYNQRFNAALAADRLPITRSLFAAIPDDNALATYPAMDKLVAHRPAAPAMLPDGVTWTGAVSPAGQLGTAPATRALAVPDSSGPMRVGDARGFALAIYGDFAGVVRVTPQSTRAGTFTPAFVDLTAGANIAVVQFTPTEPGTHAVTAANNRGLAAPAAAFDVEAVLIAIAPAPLTATALFGGQVQARPVIEAALPAAAVFAASLEARPQLAAALAAAAAFAAQLTARPEFVAELPATGLLSGQIEARPQLAASFAATGIFAAQIFGPAFVGGSLAARGLFAGQVQARPLLSGSFAAAGLFAAPALATFVPLAGSFVAQARFVAGLIVTALIDTARPDDGRVIARQREPLDALIWRSVGSTAGLEATLALNPHLAGLADALPEGTPVIVAPLAAQGPSRPAPASSPLVQLWD